VKKAIFFFAGTERPTEAHVTVKKIGIFEQKLVMKSWISSLKKYHILI